MPAAPSYGRGDAMAEQRRVAIVTGAARGIGARTAVRLAERGWSVGLVDGCQDDPALAYPMAREEELHMVAEEVERLGADALPIVTDVRDPGAIRAAVASVAERLGGLDAAVAGAGAIAGGEPAWATGEALWRAMFDVNLAGVRHLAEAAIPLLLAAPEPRWGRFVAIGSAAGALGLRGLAPYGAAKHAVIGYIRGLAADLGDSGVTANVVSPGSTRTAMLEASARLYDLPDVRELAVHQVLGRLLEPEEPAAAAAWLCSAEAGGITGSVVAVDGGMTSVR